MLSFLARFEPDTDKGGFVVTFPEFGWGVTQGDTEAEALEMAVDALSMVVADCIDRGKELPRPRKLRGAKYRAIQLPALQSAKAELYMAFRAAGISKTELARRLGIPKTTVHRLFDFKNSTRLDQLESAFRVLGKCLAVEIRDAA